MTTVYLCLICFLLLLAVFDLFAGVSNDAVNFLSSAIGAKVASFRTILIVASAGVLLGALMSAGMMDVARHGIMLPAKYSFEEVMYVFMAVMVTDVIVLDMFNTLGLPTSTTVSLVFELLGAAFIMAIIKISHEPTLAMGELLNSDKALSVIIAIFVSVAIAFVFGMIVQFIARIVFTFNYKQHLRYTIALFGGIAFTTLAYFIFIKGLATSPMISEHVQQWVKTNTQMLIALTFVATTVLSQVMHWLKIDVFKVVVLTGTFALAMAFAGNDLVNFIGVPLAGLSAYQDWAAHGSPAPDSFMMTSLMESAKSPFIYLFLAGLIMIVAISTSKKAQNVVKTSVDLSRQDEGDEMFGTSKAARSIVRATEDSKNFVLNLIPTSVIQWINGRFHTNGASEAMNAQKDEAFDIIRAAVNLVLASMLIVFGTTYKLPLSTTYVTFMVAMGSSLADRAWSRESAVFRVTGVLSVVGGWFVTAGVAFAASAIVCAIMRFVGMPAIVLFVVLVVIVLVRSEKNYKSKKEKEDSTFSTIMKTRDEDIVWQLLRNYVQRTQTFVCQFTLNQYNRIVDGLINESLKELRLVRSELSEEQAMLKKFRKKQFLALRKAPQSLAIEKNTWFHIGANANQQFVYCLKRMLDPVKEHVENHFMPLTREMQQNFRTVQRDVNELMKRSEQMIATGRFDDYDKCLSDADEYKEHLSELREAQLNQMQTEAGTVNYKISLVYLNLIQETQEMLSIMRHQLRAAKKFLQEN